MYLQKFYCIQEIIIGYTTTAEIEMSNIFLVQFIFLLEFIGLINCVYTANIGTQTLALSYQSQTPPNNLNTYTPFVELYMKESHMSGLVHEENTTQLCVLRFILQLKLPHTHKYKLWIATIISQNINIYR